MRGRCEFPVKGSAISGFAGFRRTLRGVARILLTLHDSALAAALHAAGHATTGDPAGADLAIASAVEPELPSLVVLAVDSTDRVVEALQAGAADVVDASATPAEIVARVGAILRRTRRAPTPALRFGDLSLDEERHEVLLGERPIELTGTEFRLLRYFLLNPRRVLTKAQILQAVWESDTAHRSNVVETYVAYLRRKVGPQRITTVRQTGYMLDG
jgi:DNA-binding response OmpR family regulator